MSYVTAVIVYGRNK